ENHADAIEDAVAEGEFFQMQTFQQALIGLVCAGEVDREIAANAANNRHDFLIALEREQKRRAAAELEQEPEPDAAEEQEPAPEATLLVAPPPLEDEPPGLRIVRPAGQ
ncbi:MAG TPA: hypothetical protein VFL66_09405, partial [Gaiellaceae bacterium]|nr:hypothetical protein [Gaiellaceae bacterium]